MERWVGWGGGGMKNVAKNVHPETSQKLSLAHFVKQYAILAGEKRFNINTSCVHPALIRSP